MTKSISIVLVMMIHHSTVYYTGVALPLTECALFSEDSTTAGFVENEYPQTTPAQVEYDVQESTPAYVEYEYPETTPAYVEYEYPETTPAYVEYEDPTTPQQFPRRIVLLKNTCLVVYQARIMELIFFTINMMQMLFEPVLIMNAVQGVARLMMS